MGCKSASVHSYLHHLATLYFATAHLSTDYERTLRGGFMFHNLSGTFVRQFELSKYMQTNIMAYEILLKIC